VDSWPVRAAAARAGSAQGARDTTVRALGYLPHADAGMRGVAGDGEAILCEDNNGLRWEPA
jgi:hypothetical protein